jgi:phosphatidylglycerophosphatase A
VHVVVVVLGFVVGIWLCGASSRRLGVHDHSGIVFDEIVSMWAMLALLPRQPAWSLAGFLAFRIMDVWKPWPIREADHRIAGGLGIMLDDVLAAAFAAVIVSSLWKLSAFLP